MAVEDKTPLEGEQKVEDQKQEVKFTPAEEKAMEAGWVPQDQWEGDPDAWRPAKEFLDRGELFKKIEDQSRSVKELKKALAELQSHHSKVRETEYNRALAALKAQKKTALEEGDADAVIKLDDQIDLVRDEQTKLRNTPKPVDAEVTPNPEFTAWVDRNKWYETSRPMKAFADDLGRELALRGNSPNEVLKEVERQIKIEFPDKFRNPNRDKPNAVEGSSGKGGKSSTDKYDLSDDENRVMQRFIRTIPGFSKEQYIAELKRVKGA